MLELADAQKQIIAAAGTFPGEPILLEEACGRVVAQDISAKLDLPGFDNSGMDGYAVRASDIQSASEHHQIRLRLSGKLPAGSSAPLALAPMECVRVFTGSRLPMGADAVVMQEDTASTPDDNGIVFSEPVKPWENVRFRGEDVKNGQLLMSRGEQISPGHLALLGAQGLEKVEVARRPVLGIVATGHELKAAGISLREGEIYESNRLMLASLARRSGAEPKIFPLVSDDLGATVSALRAAFDSCDAVATSGGVSVGELDFVKDAFKELGGSLEFWRISMKPGKPFVFGKLGDKFLFGLPGNPVSAFVTFVQLVAPALGKMLGKRNVFWPTHPAILGAPLHNRGERRHFMRVRVDGHGLAHSAGTQASHVLGSLAAADGLVEVPPNTTLDAGKLVSVLALR